MPLPKVSSEDLNNISSSQDPVDTVSITNGSQSSTPPSLNPDATPMPLPFYDGGIQSSPGNPGTGETPPNINPDLQLNPDATPMPLPYYDGGIQSSPGNPGTGEIPPNINPDLQLNPDATPMPLPHYQPGSFFSSVA